MSTYTDQTAILGEIQMADLIALTDDDNTGNLNSTVLNQAITNASGIIDRYCANIYGTQLPFVPTPSSVASMALTIVCYNLYRRREVPFEKNKYGEQYKEVIDFLKQVNTGDMHLNDVPFRDFSQATFTGRSTIYGNMNSNQPAGSM